MKTSEVCAVCRTEYPLSTPEMHVVSLYECCMSHRVVVETSSIKRDGGVIVDMQAAPRGEYGKTQRK